MGGDLLELVHLVPLVGELADPLDELLEVHLQEKHLITPPGQTPGSPPGRHRPCRKYLAGRKESPGYRRHSQ